MEQGIDELIKALIPEALNRLPEDINSFHFRRNRRKEEMEHEIDEIIETLVSCIWIELNKINNTDNICLLREDLGKEEIEEKIGKIIQELFGHTLVNLVNARHKVGVLKSSQLECFIKDKNVQLRHEPNNNINSIIQTNKVNLTCLEGKGFKKHFGIGEPNNHTFDAESQDLDATRERIDFSVMSHSDFEELIDKYLADELSEDNQKSFEEHMIDCRSCEEKAMLSQAIVDGLIILKKK